MEYYGLGYSNIRLPDSGNNHAYQYNYNYNTFPEEVYIHEFLHTLERNAESYGYDIPALHDYQKYGYVEERLEGQKKWYTDYMNKQINDNGKMIGLPSQIFNYKPAHESDFKYSMQVNALKEPSNIIEVIRSIIDRIGRLFSYYRNSENVEFSGSIVKEFEK